MTGSSAVSLGAGAGGARGGGAGGRVAVVAFGGAGAATERELDAHPRPESTASSVQPTRDMFEVCQPLISNASGARRRYDLRSVA